MKWFDWSQLTILLGVVDAALLLVGSLSPPLPDQYIQIFGWPGIMLGLISIVFAVGNQLQAFWLVVLPALVMLVEDITQAFLFARMDALPATTKIGAGLIVAGLLMLIAAALIDNARNGTSPWLEHLFD